MPDLGVGRCALPHIRLDPRCGRPFTHDPLAAVFRLDWAEIWALAFAFLAAFGLGLESLLAKERLFSSTKDKLLAAISTFQAAVAELHSSYSNSTIYRGRTRSLDSALRAP
jgi:hypothetical protein